MSSIGSGALDRILSQVRALGNARRTGGKEKAAAASVVALVYLAVVFRQGKRPKLVCRRSGHNVRVLRALAGVVDRPYYPSWLTPNAHVNCLLGYAKRGITVSKTRELIRCWDGGTFAMDWRNRDRDQPDLPADAPTLLVIHGLNGHSEEACVLYSMENAHKRGWRAVAMNHRGCGGTRLTSGWTYNGAFTGDVRLAVSHVRNRYPEAPLYAIGYSLGANLLVKYLGEEGRNGFRPLAGAVSVSNPWNFEDNTMASGRAKGLVAAVMGKVYSLALATGVKASMKPHVDNEFLRRRKEIDFAGSFRAMTLWEIDSNVVVPMWGYTDAAHYHRDGSSSRYLADVRCPLLCINAEDDPICQTALFPLEEARRNPWVIFVITKAGGHIGFGEGFNPWGRQSWADRLVTRYFDALTAERARCDEEATAAASTGSTTVPVPAGSDPAEGTRESTRRPLPPAAVAASARL
ncbi:unnamed protein product [Ectocarpus sp. 12 AP-2014]